MIRKIAVIFCENEHGCGEVTFPSIGDLDAQQIINDGVIPAGVIRAEAKAKGWGRVNGGDYCPACMESM